MRIVDRAVELARQNLVSRGSSSSERTAASLRATIARGENCASSAATISGVARSIP